MINHHLTEMKFKFLVNRIINSLMTELGDRDISLHLNRGIDVINV